MKILSEKNKTDSVKEDHQQMDFYTQNCFKSNRNLTWLQILFA